MKQHHLWIAALGLISLGLTACQSTRTIQVSDDSPVKPIYENGSPILISQKKHSVLVRLLTPEFGKELSDLPALLVLVQNRGDTPFDISTTNISARSGTVPVAVYTYEELQKAIKHQANMMALALAMNGASQSMAAAMPQQTYSTGSAYAYGTGGSATANYYGTTTTYNPQAAAAAQAQINANTAAQMASVANARNSQLNSIGNMLRRETVTPGKMSGGMIKLHVEKIRSNQPLTLIINLDEEQHEFQFNVGK